MKKENYLNLTSFLSLIFKLVAYFNIFAAVFFFFLLLSKDSSWEVNNSQTLVLLQIKSGTFTPQKEIIAKYVSFIVGITNILLFLPINFKVSQLFKNLSRGTSPFTLDTVTTIHQIGKWLCWLSLFPLFHSLLLSLFTWTLQLTIGISYDLFIGLILLVVAEVIRYGVELKEFNDEVV